MTIGKFPESLGRARLANGSSTSFGAVRFYESIKHEMFASQFQC
jgi:hypothetical protein